LHKSERPTLPHNSIATWERYRWSCVRMI
jgi:hypothetical protein